MSDDPILAAIQAARYAAAIMRRTAGEGPLPDPESAAGLNHPAYEEPQTPGPETTRIPPDAPHDEWRPRHGDLDHLQWHPPYGETHVKYHVYPIRGGGAGSFSGKPKFYRANSHGIYQGMQTLPDPGGRRPSIEMPKYSNEDEPERVLNENGSHPLNFRSLMEAQSAAEAHYEQNYRQPPKHDYDIDSIMNDQPTPSTHKGLGDDEDYSRIFDAVRRALRQATAALRRVAFTGDGDWKIDQRGNHECRLENGHVLYCTQVKSRPEVGWQWGIYDRNQEDPEKRAYAVRQGGQHWGGFTADDPQDHLPTAEHARRQAEQEYQKMFPLGTDTGGHKSQIGDSGVDYEKLINSRADLGDEDYGHIFGMIRTALRQASRIAGLDEYIDPYSHDEGWYGPDDKMTEQGYESWKRKFDVCPHCHGIGGIHTHRCQTEQEQKAQDWNPDDDMDPFDPRIIGAGLHARYATTASPISDAVLRRIAAELSPPCPDCGQVAGFEEHPMSASLMVCRNCEYPMLDSDIDGLLKQTLGDWDKVISEIPEIDHPGLGKHGSVEPWMDPEEFIKYHNDYFGKESDPTTQRNIRDMSTHSLHSYWQDLEKNRGKTPEQRRQEREQGKARAKEIADDLWNAFYPPEEEEGRKSVQNMDTVGKLMDNGWQPEHIKYDDDDRPYGHYQHPSGWSVTDYGGMYKEIGHAATPGESHEAINVSRNIDGQDYHTPFGPADAHAFIENQLHGDPEETGGTLHHLMENHPRIRRYKPRTAQLNDDDIIKRIDEQLAEGEKSTRDDDAGDFFNLLNDHLTPKGPGTYVVRSPEGDRRWEAEDADHAAEQHRNAFPEESINKIFRD